MDHKDILAIAIVVAIVLFGGKLIPNNPISLMANYIKNLVTSRL